MKMIKLNEMRVTWNWILMLLEANHLDLLCPQKVRSMMTMSKNLLSQRISQSLETKDKTAVKAIQA